MSMMSCQVDHGARCCCHGKFIRTGMRIFVWKTVEGLKKEIERERGGGGEGKKEREGGRKKERERERKKERDGGGGGGQ